METIEGVVERITYRADDGSGFVVAKIKEPMKTVVTAIVGNLGPVNVGENLRLHGFWEDSKKYKTTQFRVSSYETLTPATINGIEKYLGSGIIKGLGEKTARRIVAKFGLDTFYVIENSPEKLLEVDKLGESMLKKIKNGWETNRQIKDVMVFLQGQDISPSYASRIYKEYQENTIAYVKGNPYRLADDIHGIGFKKADQIALKFGIAEDSPFRIEAFVIYWLRNASSEGHVFYPYDLLINECMDELNVDRVHIEKAITSLSSEEKDRVKIDSIVLGQSEEQTKNNLIDTRIVYLKSLYLAETIAAQRLHELKSVFFPKLKNNVDNAILDYQRESNIVLSDRQKDAVKKAVSSKVMVITGGPGTGKTTIIKCICYIFERLSLRIKLAAPTGRASKRMKEATGLDSLTIHRLLEYSPGMSSYTRHRNRPLDTDVLIVDEFSMVDISLFSRLIDAVPLSARMIMVGDIDQLPSVGPGNVLRDIISSGVISVIELTEIHRQKGDSFIIKNAHNINNGRPLLLPTRMDKSVLHDFYYIVQDDKQDIIETIVKLCTDRIPARFRYDPIEDIQVLSPMRVRDLGVTNLNRILQDALNTNSTQIVRGRTIFKVGDKVMQTKNNYDKDVFNGDIGRIKSINTDDGTLIIQFDDGKLVTYEMNELDEILHAYAISIHKSQGSEYKAVIIPLHTQHYIMLKRNLLYTAVTRGKKLVIIIGSRKALDISIKNSDVLSRYTLLSQRLVNIENNKK